MRRIAVSIILLLLCVPQWAQRIGVTSPNGRQAAQVEVTSVGGCTRVTYETSFDGHRVVLPSAIDLGIDNHVWEMATGKRSLPKTERWMDNLSLAGTEVTSRDTVWHNAYGERSTVRDAYNGMVLHFVKEDGSKCGLDIEFRAYDEGIAWRFSLPMHPDALYHRVKADNSEFAFPEGTKAWYHLWAQSTFELLPLEGWADECERPLTLELPGGLYAAVGEAGLVDFPRGKLRLLRR